MLAISADSLWIDRSSWGSEASIALADIQQLWVWRNRQAAVAGAGAVVFGGVGYLLSGFCGFDEGVCTFENRAVPTLLFAGVGALIGLGLGSLASGYESYYENPQISLVPEPGGGIAVEVALKLYR